MSLGTPARRHTPNKRNGTTPSPTPMPAASAPPPAAGQPRGDDAAADRRRLVVLAAGVLTVWALLLAAAVSPRPLFLISPPINRRAANFFLFKRDGCGQALVQGSWTDDCRSVRCTDATQLEFATCADTPRRHWRFSQEAKACGARRLAPADARQRLAGQRLVFAGDSIARNLAAHALHATGGDATPAAAGTAQGIVVGHADFQHQLEGGIELEFYWAPYPSNLTGVLQRRLAPAAAAQRGAAAAGGAEAGEERQAGEGAAAAGEAGAEARAAAAAAAEQQQQDRHQEDSTRRRRGLLQEPSAAAASQLAKGRRQPSVVLLSATLWHLLHVTSPADFQTELGLLNAAAEGYRRAADEVAAAAGGAAGTAPRLVLTSSTETFPNRMRTQDKRQSMTPANVDAYNAAIEKAGVLDPAGSFSLLDLFPLTQQCGEECSTDGVHSSPEVYDAALQMLLNTVAADAVGSGAAARPERRRRRRALLEPPHAWPRR
ncbi:hypothetical protein CHLNCDRAFT_141365 [Chlorella variabilis]|uniref:Uncharacterized protein n=1 Tax=Chlorella variabilis TaxID=554065 RepID=E1ZSQ8_CHLVA|nr:hypothetical protein CHLNCDRAFT_141365 [Chlorella variabilis]EFN51194.1 hypothetical protein CHLNCDRAFT_141365 [Chlorella variabilis]|eukprot:XP_005843296.1 hypothetical protein CHLNCDRAFT_141365 [Chlorella variabilis]